MLPIENFGRLSAARLVGIFLLYLKWILSPVIWALDLRASHKIPPVHDAVLELSATTLAARIRRKEIKCEYLVRKFIERIEMVNGILNAVVDERFLLAIVDARKVDEFISKTTLSEEELARDKPLLGVPMTVKESCKVKGLSFAVGCKTRLGFVAEDDGEGVAKIKAAGAIILLVSNTPETCFGMECDNLITGTTSNPYNTNYTCGGSSGGEGALVASGASALGLGSDVGGSIRIPCMFNGIFGHKPTAGTSPIGAHYPMCEDKKFYSFLTLGPMCRYAEDLKLLLKVVVDDRVNLDEQIDVTQLTVCYMEDMGNLFKVPVEKEIKDALLNCVRYLGGRGSKISDTKFRELGGSFEMSTALYASVGNRPDLFLNQNNPKERYNFYVEVLKYIFSCSTLHYNTLGYYVLDRTNVLAVKFNLPEFEELAERTKAKFQQHLGKYGVLLYPTFPSSTFQKKQTVLNAVGITYTMVFNVLGFPSTHVPLGLNKKGLPIGIQVVANPGRDVLCLAVAEELERGFGGWVPPYK